MSGWAELREGVRKAILLQERIERLAGGVGRLEERLLDHERRLVRIETMIEMARTAGPHPRPPGVD